MPPLRLTSLLHDAVPALSPASRAVVSALACRNGDAHPAAAIAEWVGLRDRFRLARQLRRDGLPSLERLAGWTRVLYWMLDAESSGASLLQLARHDGIDPAVAYRLVRRVTGQRWSEARRAGLPALVERVREACRPSMHNAGLPAAGARHAHSGGRRTAAPAPATAPAISEVRGLGARLAVGGSPFDVAIGPHGTAYVSRLHAAAVDCVALEPLRTIASIRVGSAPTTIAMERSGTRAYVTNQFTENVSVIDLILRREIGALRVHGHPLGVVCSHDGRTLFVTTNLDRLCAISLVQGTVVASLVIPPAGVHLVLSPSGAHLYVSTWTAGVILEVDARTLRQTRCFKVGGAVQRLAISDDGTMLFAPNESGWLDVVRLGTGRAVERLSLGAPAFSVALSPDGETVYVGLASAGQIAQVDRLTWQIRAILRPGGKPRGIAFDPVSRAGFVANEAGWVDSVGGRVTSPL